MVTFSCWRFKEIYNLDDIIMNINSNISKYVSSDCCIEVDTIHGSSIEKNIFNILDTEIKYIFFKLNTNFSDQSKNKELKVLIYEFENSIKINAFMGCQNACKILNMYFSENLLSPVIDDKPELSEDLLYWMFKSFIDNPKQPLNSSKSIYINSLKRYRGVTKDQHNTLMGDGERISDILGTLAFLLDNDDLKMLSPKVIYNCPVFGLHCILVEMRLTGTLKFDLSHYTGNFSSISDVDKLNLIISILYSRIILPAIIESYKNSRIQHSWSPTIKRNFIRDIGEKIKERVDIELHKLDQEIELESKKSNVYNMNFIASTEYSDLEEELADNE